MHQAHQVNTLIHFKKTSAQTIRIGCCRLLHESNLMLAMNFLHRQCLYDQHRTGVPISRGNQGLESNPWLCLRLTRCLHMLLGLILGFLNLVQLLTEHQLDLLLNSFAVALGPLPHALHACSACMQAQTCSGCMHVSTRHA
eukprot:357162-Chlamydomonas_euryale.AAC.11